MSNYNDFGSGSNREYNEHGFEDVTPENCVMYLTQAWINERASPDILQYEQAATNEVLSKIEEQTIILDDMDSGNDTIMIISILYQTELERVKFVLRSYLRTRISKIEKFCEYILSNEDGRLDRLSAAERTHAQK
ncbi:GINS complex subunit [Entomortierella beljakovae]|nr:GINS complex subunit [Entomortierella beljakovae]